MTSEEMEKELPLKQGFWKMFRIWHLTYRMHWNKDQKHKVDKRHQKYRDTLKGLGVNS